MKLIILYGQPATGKRTTGLELSRITNFPLFHNHVSIEVVRSIFSKKDESYFDLVESVRMNVFEHFFKAKKDGMIFTWFYWGDKRDLNFVKNIHELSIALGFKVYCVKLNTSVNELKTRVNSDQRRQLNKPASWEEWEKATDQWSDSNIICENHIELDNTNQSAVNIAKQIEKWISKK